MKRMFLMIAAMVVALPAMAADLKGGTARTASDTPLAGTLYQGSYAGLDLGGQFTNIDLGGTFDGIGADGLVGGAHAGYLFSAGSFRAGPWVEAGLSNVNTKLGGLSLLTQDYYAAGGASVCYQPGRSLVCGRGGYAWSQWSSDYASGDAHVYSWLVGGSVETMLTTNLSVGLTADYLIPEHVEYGGTTVTGINPESLVIKAGLTFRR